MTKARTNASASPAVGRNMVINGAMNVAQRSTSVTGLGATDGYYTCDRWFTNFNGTAGRLTQTQTADGPNGISANCLKLDCTTADTSIAASEFLILAQKIEGQNLQRIGKGVAGAKQITVSFYVKASAAFTFACELFDLDNTRQISKLFNVTTDWNRIELIFPADVDDGSSPFGDDNAASLELQFWLHAGTNFTSGTLNSSSWANNSNTKRAGGINSFFSDAANNFFITGVQMEVGPVATEFEQEDISTTLAKCQRYFQGNGRLIQTGDGVIGYLQASSLLPVEMRVTPTAVIRDNAGTTGKVSADSTNNIAGTTTGLSTTFVSAGANNVVIGNNVFMNVHFTLDAEL